MIRYVCWLALLGVGAVPDWASAFGRRCSSGPVFYGAAYYPPPVYYAPPVYYYPPPVYYAPCVPVYVAAADCPPATGTKMTKAAETPKGTSTAETVRPASGVTLPLRSPVADDKLPAPPKLDLPKSDAPKWEAPKLDPPKLDPPKLDVPKLDVPKLEVPLSPAGRDAAPAGAGGEPSGPLIPPPHLPSIPETPKKADALPPLVLPPETPPAKGGTTAKSSPLTAGVTAQTYTASGKRSADGLHAIGFYNHTSRDLSLTIEGKDVKLPAKSYLTARVGSSFKWKHGDNPLETATVPADAAGLDVVFREE